MNKSDPPAWRLLWLAGIGLSLPAVVVLIVWTGPPASFSPRLAASVLLAWLALGLATHEALAVAWARGPQRQQQALAAFAQQLSEGRFDGEALPVTARSADADLLALRAALRDLHEERARLHRLLAALRASEPERARRDAIDALRQAIDGDDRFAEGELCICPPPLPGRRLSVPRAAGVLALAAAAWWLAGFVR